MIAHDEALLDAVAALAVGALAPRDAREAEAHVAVCSTCRADFRRLSFAVDATAVAASATRDTLDEASAARMKRSILHAAVAARPPAVVAPAGLVPLEPGIAWAVTAAAGMTLVYWVFEPPKCTELPAESHEQTQGGIVLSGSMTLHYGDGTEQRCRAGDVYAIAPGMVHGASFTERTVLFDVYTPNHTAFEERYRSAREL